jgi:hypothetical protein
MLYSRRETCTPVPDTHMGFPPTSRLPIQLLPQVPRAFSISSAGLSLSLHGGLLALAVAGTGHWLTFRTSVRAYLFATVRNLGVDHPRRRCMHRIRASVTGPLALP